MYIEVKSQAKAQHCELENLCNFYISTPSFQIIYPVPSSFISPSPHFKLSTRSLQVLYLHPLISNYIPGPFKLYISTPHFKLYTRSLQVFRDGHIKLPFLNKLTEFSIIINNISFVNVIFHFSSKTSLCLQNCLIIIKTFACLPNFPVIIKNPAPLFTEFSDYY